MTPHFRFGCSANKSANKLSDFMIFATSNLTLVFLFVGSG